MSSASRSNWSQTNSTGTRDRQVILSIEKGTQTNCTNGVSLCTTSVRIIYNHPVSFFFFFFLNDPPPTDISPLPHPAPLPTPARGAPPANAPTRVRRDRRRGLGR